MQESSEISYFEIMNTLPQFQFNIQKFGNPMYHRTSLYLTLPLP